MANQQRGRPVMTTREEYCFWWTKVLKTTEVYLTEVVGDCEGFFDVLVPQVGINIFNRRWTVSEDQLMECIRRVKGNLASNKLPYEIGAINTPINHWECAKSPMMRSTIFLSWTQLNDQQWSIIMSVPSLIDPANSPK